MKAPLDNAQDSKDREKVVSFHGGAAVQESQRPSFARALFQSGTKDADTQSQSLYFDVNRSMRHCHCDYRSNSLITTIMFAPQLQICCQQNNTLYANKVHI